MKPYGVTRTSSRNDRSARTFRKASKRASSRIVDTKAARADGKRDLLQWFKDLFR